MSVGAQNDQVPVWRQSNLEMIEEKYHFEILRCALRQGFVVALSIRRRHHPPFPHFPTANGSG
jgi:hypothetical protein